VSSIHHIVVLKEDAPLESELPASLIGGSRFQLKIENVFKWVKLRVFVAKFQYLQVIVHSVAKHQTKTT
jgi:hypothetical protein